MPSFTYTRDRPDAGNNPSVDQPVMKINTNSIDDLIAVDHVSFNASGGGNHEQVTFNSNNIPSIPTSPPVLFTQNDAFSTPQLRFYSGSTAKTSDQYNASSSGSTMLLGGIIMKWGSYTQNTIPQTITFPTPFPNTCFMVITQPIASTTRSAVPSVSTTSFVSSGSGGANYYYMAIGN